jgi:hypothetical protein
MSGYCVPNDCENRLPLGDYKSCNMPEDETNCYYKLPQTVCLTDPCPQVFYDLFLFYLIYRNALKFVRLITVLQ